MSSRFVQKDNSLSLEALRIGYEFSPELVHKWGLGSLRLNAYMNDIFRLSTIKMERGTSFRTQCVFRHFINFINPIS